MNRTTLTHRDALDELHVGRAVEDAGLQERFEERASWLRRNLETTARNLAQAVLGDLEPDLRADRARVARIMRRLLVHELAKEA